MLQRLGNWTAGLLRNRSTDVAAYSGSSSGSLPEHLDDPSLVLGNPLRSMGPLQAVGILEQGIRGEWTRAQWLMYWIEQVDADVWTLVDRRTSGLRQLDWTIRTDADAGERGLESLAEEQEQALREGYMRITNMREAVEALAMAKFRGFAHLAIGDDGNAQTATKLEPLDQWWWVRDGMYGPWYWNPEARADTAKSLGNPIAPERFVIREERRSLLWLAILKYLRATYCHKWWDQFLEISTRRGIVVIAPENLAEPSRTSFMQHVANIVRGAGGHLPFGSDVKMSGPDQQGIAQTIWESRLRYLKEDLILAGTGGMLTAIAQPTGIGGSQGQEQGDVWRSILRADAQTISETLQEQFDKSLLDKAFPGKPALAWFELDTSEKPTPKSILEEAKLASDAGLEIDLDELCEKTGYTITRKAPPPPPPPPTIIPPAESPESTASTESPESPESPGLANRRLLANRAAGAEALSASLASELGVPDAWLAPVSDWLATLEAKAADKTISDADLAAFLSDAVKQVPELFGKMDVAALSGMFERAMGAAAIDGARTAMQEIPRGAPDWGIV